MFTFIKVILYSLALIFGLRLLTEDGILGLKMLGFFLITSTIFINDLMDELKYDIENFIEKRNKKLKEKDPYRDVKGNIFEHNYPEFMFDFED